jgi:CRP-like cAMP-binding protein
MVRCCSSACDFHFKLIENMLKIVAEKNIRLNEKIILLSRRTIREKVLYYLLAESGKSENRIITIPFNRNELADYICVDRSALSRELCKMRNEGIIDFHKNRFKLLDIDKIKNVIGED